MDESRHLLVTHVREASAFIDDAGNVDLGDGKVVHPRVLQRLGCDAILQGMLDGLDGRPLDLGRRARTATMNQKVAIAARYPTCRVGDCRVKSKDCQFHHVNFWEHGGRTDLDNLVPLCGRHHKLVHEGGWGLVLDHRGQVVLLPPDGRPPLTEVPMLSDVSVSADSLVDANRAAGRGPAGDAGMTLMGYAGGERMDAWTFATIVESLVGAEGLAWPSG